MARKKSSYDGPVYYTTYQVAKFLGVSLPTVVNWVNNGLLAAHRTPGGHRRIAQRCRGECCGVDRGRSASRTRGSLVTLIDDTTDLPDPWSEVIGQDIATATELLS